MGEVKTPGQVAREAFYAAEDGWAAVAHAVLYADPVRTQALELVEWMADALDTHLTTLHDDDLIEIARELVRKAREASKP